jgi:leucyl aminopeptidase
MTERDLPEVVATRGGLPGYTFLTDDAVSAVVVAVAPAAEVDDGPEPRAGVVDAAALYRVDLAEMALREGLTGGAGELTTVSLPRPHLGARDEFPWSDLPPRIVLLGVGSSSRDDHRRAGAALARATTGFERVVCAALAGAGSDGVEAFVEGYLLAAYRRPLRRGSGGQESGGRESPERPGPSAGASAGAAQLVVLDPQIVHEPALARARATAGAVWLARDLANEPTDVKDPSWFADRAARTVRDARDAGLSVSVLGRRELAAAGLGGILAASSGSARGPRLVTVSYQPESPDQPESPGRHVVIVGGGTTYDSGGLDIRPRLEMPATTTDSAGAAAALGAVIGAARLGSTCRVTAVLPLVENGIGEAALRAGDVVTLGSGRRVEVVRPGESARLALADGLAYAARELAPDVLVDISTLTSAATSALGPGRAALFTADDALASTFEDASRASGDPLWRLPLIEDYRDSLASGVADLRDVSSEQGAGGAITAALFLRDALSGVAAAESGGLVWAHLDVTAHARSSAGAAEHPAGATGFGVRLLLALIERLAV